MLAGLRRCAATDWVRTSAQHFFDIFSWSGGDFAYVIVGVTGGHDTGGLTDRKYIHAHDEFLTYR